MKFFYKLYADDLVVFLKESQIKHFLEKFIKVSNIFNLKLNPIKCAILAVQNHTEVLPSSLFSFQIPLRKDYKYLGIVIDNKGSL